MTKTVDHTPLALTMGEPAGIGPEITLLAWQCRAQDKLPPFFVIADPELLADRANLLGLDLPLREIATPAEAMAAFDHGLPVLAQPLPEPSQPGKPAIGNGVAVIESIARAASFCLDGQARAMVTNPIHKAVLYEGGFRHPGHTEFVAELSGGGEPVMMLISPDLRTVPVTVHVSLAEAVAALNTDLIFRQGEISARALRQDFAIAAPRLAVAGLNPHAGENGKMGREDLDIIAPAVKALQAAGIDARGPLAPDTMFHAAARQTYDLAICMYHDQALIPLKTLGFDDGVNVTAGLPIVRTSPDHGTAFDLAGKGTANTGSLRNALRLAGEIAENRARPPRSA